MPFLRLSNKGIEVVLCKNFKTAKEVSDLD
jgi:hypothetical protein